MADVQRSRGKKCGNHEEDCKDEQERGLYQNCQAEKKMNKGSLIYLDIEMKVYYNGNICQPSTMLHFKVLIVG